MPAAGAVQILFGSAAGLTGISDQLWTQDTAGIDDESEVSDAFGLSIAVGDFGGTSHVDLAIGVPYEDFGPEADEVQDAGAVQILLGSPAGLTAAGSQFWTQDSGFVLDQMERFDYFGLALAGADFGGSPYADLAIGLPFEDVRSGGRTVVPETSNAGAVEVLYGSSTGLTDVGNQLWRQGKGGLTDPAEEGDGFGTALAAADFGGAAQADLAIGVRYESLGPPGSEILYAGAVSVLYGSGAGLVAAGNQLWTQDTAGVEDVAEEGDLFGSSLAAGDIDGSGQFDLIVGVFGEGLGAGREQAGAVNVAYGSPAGLADIGDQFWTQDSPGIRDTAEGDDHFGRSVA